MNVKFPVLLAATTSCCLLMACIDRGTAIQEAEKENRAEEKPKTSPLVKEVQAVVPDAGGAPSFVALVTDRSDSVERGDGAACAAVRTLVESALLRRDAFANLHIVPGLTQLKLLGTADTSAPGIPRELTPVLTVRALPAVLPPPEEKAPNFLSSTARREMEESQAKAISAAAEQTRQQFSDHLRALVETARHACDGQPQKISPIYSAVKAGTSWLKTKLSTPGSDGVLIIQSDLDESFEKEIRDARKAVLAGKKVDLQGLRDRLGLDLEGKIAVHVCGIAQGVDTQQESARDKVVALWRDNILLNAKSFTVLPLCEGYRPSTDKAAVGQRQ